MLIATHFTTLKLSCQSLHRRHKDRGDRLGCGVFIAVIVLYESLAKQRKSKPNAIFILGGDFNLPKVNWTNMSVTKNSRNKNSSQKLIDLFSVFAFEQINTDATRMISFCKGNILNLLVTSHPKLFHRLSVEEGISDH